MSKHASSTMKQELAGGTDRQCPVCHTGRIVGACDHTAWASLARWVDQLWFVAGCGNGVEGLVGAVIV